MGEAIRLRWTRSSLLNATMRQPTVTFNPASTPSVVPGKDRVKEAIKRAAKKARRVFSAMRSLLPTRVLKRVLIGKPLCFNKILTRNGSAKLLNSLPGSGTARLLAATKTRLSVSSVPFKL